MCMNRQLVIDDQGIVRRKHTTARMVMFTAAIIVAVDVCVDFLLTKLGTGGLGDNVIRRSALASSAGVGLWLTVIRPLRREADRARLVSTQREEALVVQSRRQEFETALHRAMEMAGTIDEVYRTMSKAMAVGVPNLDVELLLADSSEAHLKLAVAVGGDERRARCDVVTPRDCPAIRRAQTLMFSSSEALDACPHLENRQAGPCSAVCVPVSVGGRSIGVLHAATNPASPPTAPDATTLEAIATQSGTHIGMLRVMEATHLQAATDPLTGLLNRRSLENRAHELIRTGTPFALAMGDLDHFKKLNDTFGHDAGDRALRAFSQTLRASLRDEDLICRYGGEEFVIVFPRRSAEDAGRALMRVQQELVVSVARGNMAPVTVSFGVAHSEQENSLEELCRIADAALFRAKREGRDRIIIDKLEQNDTSTTKPVSHLDGLITVGPAIDSQHNS